MKRYIYAAQKPWSLEAFLKFRSDLPGEWTLVTTPQDLEQPRLLDGVDYIFFPHWSNIVPETLLRAHKCVCFHMTDVPFGRGGSPLQNLILRGHTDTVITALKMEQTLDSGPVYLKRPLSLAGNAREIFDRASLSIIKMIAEIVVNQPEPEPQTGAPTIFKRRTPSDSILPGTTDPNAIYDHIRMLDAPSYPQAFLDFDQMRLVFSDAQLDRDGLTAKVSFKFEDRDAK